MESAEYGRRAARAIEILQRGGVRTVLCRSLPDVRDKTLQKDITGINLIVCQQAQGRSGVMLMDTAPLFGPTPGTFSRYLIKKGGMPMQVRASDGIHLNLDGADMLAARIREQLAVPLGLKP